MTITGKFRTIEEVFEETKVPPDTIRRWSSQGIIWNPQKTFVGRKGCRSRWPEEVIEQARMVRRCIEEDGSLIDARKLIQNRFGPQASHSASTHIKLAFMGERLASDINTMLNVASLLPDVLKKNHEPEVLKVAEEKMLGYALDFESAVRKEIRKRQKELKKSRRV